jgi:hypothetical protein
MIIMQHTLLAIEVATFYITETLANYQMLLNVRSKTDQISCDKTKFAKKSTFKRSDISNQTDISRKFCNLLYVPVSRRHLTTIFAFLNLRQNSTNNPLFFTKVLISC